LHPGRVINKLTEEIVEVHLRVGRSDIYAHHCVLWMDSVGKMLASAIVIDDDRRRAISYWTPYEKYERPWANVQPIETTHNNGMYSLGMDGALALTRQFIFDQYVNREA